MFMQKFCLLLTLSWRSVFHQSRTLRRVVTFAVVYACLQGRRTISQNLSFLGRDQKDWSAEYKLFSRSHWVAEDLFIPVMAGYLRRYPDNPIVVAADDTKLPKTGRKIKTASWQRDPMSPPFHVNFILGLRFIQFSLIYQHYQEGPFAPRALPVLFQEAPVVKKPGKKASPEQLEHYRQVSKQQNLSQQTLQALQGLRARFDHLGAVGRPLILVVDGSFCNQTFFKKPLDRIDLVARCRKDARLCLPAPKGSRLKYDPDVFTPEQIRQSPDRPYQEASIHFGGQQRTIRYKTVANVLWRRGAQTRPLRLIVVAPTPYKLSPNARINYREPAYFLSTDLDQPVQQLIQAAFDRWQIEVNHRDEKSIFGLGQSQVRSSLSVPRQPALVVAIYSLLLLSSILCFGPGRTNDFPPLPKWRKNASRPSLNDLMTLMRKDQDETSISDFLDENFNKINELYDNL